MRLSELGEHGLLADSVALASGMGHDFSRMHPIRLRGARTHKLPGVSLDLPPGQQARGPVLVPAGAWVLGQLPGGFVFDVEKWAHEIDVPEVDIAKVDRDLFGVGGPGSELAHIIGHENIHL